jgi:hypothetical protein
VTSDGFILVEYRTGSGNPQLSGQTVYNDVEQAAHARREKQADKIAGKLHHRVAVARIEVLS